MILKTLIKTAKYAEMEDLGEHCGLIKMGTGLMRIWFGVPPSGGWARKPPKGGTPNPGTQAFLIRYFQPRKGIRPKCSTSQIGTANNAIAANRSQVHAK